MSMRAETNQRSRQYWASAQEKNKYSLSCVSSEFREHGCCVWGRYWLGWITR
jgi:hypothetical protein